MFLCLFPPFLCVYVCVYFSFCFPFGAIAYYVIFFQFQNVVCPDVLEFFFICLVTLRVEVVRHMRRRRLCFHFYVPVSFVFPCISSSMLAPCILYSSAKRLGHKTQDWKQSGNIYIFFLVSFFCINKFQSKSRINYQY